MSFLLCVFVKSSQLKLDFIISSKIWRKNNRSVEKKHEEDDNECDLKRRYKKKYEIYARRES